MRKLTRDQNEIMTLETINSICVCAVYCTREPAGKEYKYIQTRTDRDGETGPFRIEIEI